jgi:iron complex outermembrane receptor protein
LSPQSSGQVELGAKWREAALGLALDAALFRANTDDEIGVQTNTSGRATYQNVGRTKRQGLEIATRWQATKTVRTQLALTWLDAKYKDGFLTCTATPCPQPTVAVPAGNRIAGTAGKSAYAEVAWQALASALGNTELAVEMRAQGSVAVNDLNSDFAAGAATYALRASQTVAIGPGKLELLARLDNLGDRQYAGSVIVNDGNGRYFEPAAGRTVLLSARWKMGF